MKVTGGALQTISDRLVKRFNDKLWLQNHTALCVCFVFLFIKNRHFKRMEAESEFTERYEFFFLQLKKKYTFIDKCISRWSIWKIGYAFNSKTLSVATCSPLFCF